MNQIINIDLNKNVDNNNIDNSNDSNNYNTTYSRYKKKSLKRFFNIQFTLSIIAIFIITSIFIYYKIYLNSKEDFSNLLINNYSITKLYSNINTNSESNNVTTNENLAPNSIIGKTCNNTDEIINAINEGVDYVTFGPIFTTLTKNNDYIDYATIQWVNQNIDIPVFLTGDISLTNLEELAQTGVNKIVVTNSIMYARVPEYTAREFLKYLP